MSEATERLVGITGHQTLTPSTRKLISQAFKEDFIHEHSSVAITSLAAGTDQICAQAVLDLGGRFIVVLPARHYVKSFDAAADLENFYRASARVDSAEQLTLCTMHIPRGKKSR